MKKLLLALGILALICSGPAMAGVNANGAMLLHTNSTCSYSNGWDYCGDTGPYSAPLPPTCDELVTITTRDTGIESIIWMVGAFADGSSPSVKSYQVGLYGDITADQFSGWGFCPAVGLEIPDGGWPGAGNGTAVTYTGNAVTSHLFKMYWFACGAPATGSFMRTGNYVGGDHLAEWADTSDPAVIDVCSKFGSVGWGVEGTKDCPGVVVPPGACCFPDGHCEVLDQAACQGEFQGPGTVCSPNPCRQPVGACCLNGQCIGNLIETECAAAGGVWEGLGTDCATFTCPPPPATGACCVGTVCSVVTAEECAAAGGTYQGDNVPCTDTTCITPPPTGACCIGQDCTIQTRDECTAAGGEYKGDNVPCNTDTCIPVPTKSTTWGQIKGQYR